MTPPTITYTVTASESGGGRFKATGVTLADLPSLLVWLNAHRDWRDVQVEWIAA